METEELKKILENTAKESGLKINGEIAVLKSDEQREADKEIKEWKEDKTKFHSIKEFKIPKELMKCLFSTNQYNGFLMIGEGGLGKTILTINSVKDNFKSNEWEYFNGYITPLAFYEFLYNNRNKKVIIIDDTEGIFSNKLALSMLKGCLWEAEGKRICQYSSKSDKANVPSMFVMEANIIILCNEISKENDISTRALLTRLLFYRMDLTFKKKIEICKRFVKDENLKKNEFEKVNYILDNKINEATKDFNFRTLRKLIAFVRYNLGKAEILFEATTEVDEDKKSYLESVKKLTLVREQIKYFIEKTGKSRATFFRIKKNLIVARNKYMELKNDAK